MVKFFCDRCQREVKTLESLVGVRVNAFTKYDPDLNYCSGGFKTEPGLSFSICDVCRDVVLGALRGKP
jgi:hypothetical protein